MRIFFSILSFTLLILCVGACIYDASQNNMFCVVWAMNALINLSSFKSLRK